MDSTFTPQQSQGGPSFSNKVRIGNWSEEIQLQEDVSAYYLKAKQLGLLPQQQMKKKYESHQKHAQISSTTKEGFIKFGSILMIFSEFVDAFVSVDLDKRLDSFKERYQIALAKAKFPVQRSAFTIEKVPSKLDILINKEYEDVLHYGQTIKIRLSDGLSSKPLYLRSERSLHRTQNGHQHCFLDADSQGGDVIFKVEYIDPNQRLEREATPVMANFPMLLRHVPTGNNVNANTTLVFNDFGNENEITCHTELDIHKVEKLSNYFTFVLEKPKEN